MNRQSSNNNRRVRWRWLSRWKNALNHDYKNNSGRNFRFTKSSFIDFVFTVRRSLSRKRPKSAGGKSSGCRFSFSDERNANTKATEYATFYIWLSQNVLRKWWNNSLFSVGESNEEAASKRERSFDKRVNLWISFEKLQVEQNDKMHHKTDESCSVHSDERMATTTM